MNSLQEINKMFLTVLMITPVLSSVMIIILTKAPPTFKKSDDLERHHVIFSLFSYY